MIITTSLHPSHTCKENQQKAINSWNKYGKCYSLNNIKEIPLLEYKEITLFPHNKYTNILFGKSLININSMMDFAYNRGEDLLIINSDIILTNFPEVKEDGITIFKRWDYENSYEDGKLFDAGFDAFFIPHKYLELFPPSIFCMGGAWWDYWLPLCAIKLGIPIYYIEEKIAFHKKHSTQYSYEEWIKIGEWFRLYFSLNKELSIPQIATQTLTEINSKLI